MATVYYRPFNVKKVAATGFTVDLPGEVINVYNVSAAASLGTLQSDNDGNIPAGSFTATLGDIVEFSSGSYPKTFRQFLAATQLEAFTDPRNNVMSFIVEDLSGPATSDTSNVYAINLDDPTVKPVFLGVAKTGETSRFSYNPGVAQNARIALIAKDENNKLAPTDLTAPDVFSDIVIPATGGGAGTPTLLFANYTDTPSVGTSRTVIQSEVIDAATFVNDGDLLEAEYSGFFAANGNSKRLIVDWNGSIFFDVTVNENNTKWNVEVEVMRQSNTVVRCTGVITYGTDHAEVFNLDLTGLNLTTNNYDLRFQAETVTSAGDLTITSSFGQFWQSTGDLILIDEASLDELTNEISGARLTED